MSLTLLLPVTPVLALGRRIREVRTDPPHRDRRALHVPY